MAFPRIIKNRTQILHNVREKGRVKQIKLHVFENFKTAIDVVLSEKKWEIFCRTLDVNYGNMNINYAQLREKLKKILEGKKRKIVENPIHELCTSMTNILGYYEKPLPPKQLSTLQEAKNELVKLKELIGRKIELLDQINQEKNMRLIKTQNKNEAAEEYFNEGMNFYDNGDWDSAKEAFVQGLELDPYHVDLLVHSGLIDFLHGNYHLALPFLKKAMDIGKKYTDEEIKRNPEMFIKELDTESNDEEDDINPGLYSHLEFRPFFRSMTNKAIVLMKMKRFEEAIQSYKLCNTYQTLWGNNNQIGVCYLNMGKLEEANEWYNEFLWDEVYYIKALILFAMGKKKESLKYLLTGVTKNWHIAWMLTGSEKPEKTRYVGAGLTKYLAASEFMNEYKHLIKKYPGFKIIVRLIVDDPEIASLMEELEEADMQRKENRNYKMPDRLKRFYFGEYLDESFLDKHLPRLFSRLNDKNEPYWQPEKNEDIFVRVVEVKDYNWIVSLKENEEKTLYFRKGYEPDHQEGDIIKIRVSKSWHYGERLFVTGKIIG